MTASIGPGGRRLTIEVSNSIRPRPIWKRALLRKTGGLPGPPTEEEISDAIRVLEEGGYRDLLYDEAERLLIEWGD